MRLTTSRPTPPVPPSIQSPVNGSIASKVLERLQGDLMGLPGAQPAAAPSGAATAAGAGGGAPAPAPSLPSPPSPPPLAAVTLLVGTNDVLAETHSSLFE